jgi:hypothetical protein
MSYCGSCGEEVAADARFCGGCGAVMPAAASASGVEQAGGVPPEWERTAVLSGPGWSGHSHGASRTRIDEGAETPGPSSAGTVYEDEPSHVLVWTPGQLAHLFRSKWPTCSGRSGPAVPGVMASPD